MDEKPTWMNKDILHPDHAHDLDKDAAIHEFHGGLERSKAEEKAYGDYVLTQRKQAASHHLRGMKIAQAAGDKDQAAKHAVLYESHMKAIGKDPYDPQSADDVHKEIENLKDQAYKFRSHKGDLYAVRDMKKEE